MESLGLSPGSQAHRVDEGGRGGWAESPARAVLRGVWGGAARNGGEGLRAPSTRRTPFSWLLIRCRELLK